MLDLDPDRPLAIGFLLVPGFSLTAFTSALEPLRVANRLAGRELFRWTLLSPDGNPAATSSGLAIVAEGGIDAAPKVGCLIVCAGFAPLRHASARLDGWLRRLARFGVVLGALDTGAFLLARAGLLDGRRVTLHWEAAPAFREAHPEVELASELFVVDRDRITCAGGTAALDLALDLIARRHGRALAAATAEQLLHRRVRPGSDAQRPQPSARLGVADPRLTAALTVMEDCLSEPLPVRALAARVGIGRRALERLFRAHLGTTPLAHHRALRLGRARSLLTQTELAVREVALACGFPSLEHFSRCYRRRFGRPPRADRGRSTLPPGW